MYDVLIIGCGNIAGGFDAMRAEDAPPLTHAGAYARHPGFRIAACIDPDAGRRASFQSRWSVSASAATIDGLNAPQGAFDVISICSPTALHEEHLAAAIALQPKLIFCEKALTSSAAESARVAERCRSAGILLAVNYTRRWAPDVVRFATELRAGEWGEIRSVVGSYTKGIVHNGGHLVDLLHLLVGSLDLIAVGAPRVDFWEDDPAVPALLTSDSGVPVQLAIGHAADYALFEVVIVTSRGEIAMRDGGRRWTIRRRQPSDAFAGYDELGAPEAVAGAYDEAMSLAIENLAAALGHGAPLASDAVNAIAAQRLCESVRDAALASTASIKSH